MSHKCLSASFLSPEEKYSKDNWPCLSCHGDNRSSWEEDRAPKYLRKRINYNNGFSETFKKWYSHNITNEFFRGEIRLIAHPCLSASACASMCLHEVLSQLSPFFLLIAKL